MIELKLNIASSTHEYDSRWISVQEDIKRLQNGFKLLGYLLSPEQIYWLHHIWSDETFCAGWLIIGDSEQDVYARVLDLWEFIEEEHLIESEIILYKLSEEQAQD